MLQMVKTLRGMPEQAREVLPSELQRYLEERVLPTASYPEEDHLGLLRAVAALTGTRDYAMFGRVLADFELGHHYKAHLIEGDPLRTMQRFPLLWSMNHDTGEMTVERGPDGAIEVELAGYHLVASEVCGVVSGYAQRTIELAGGRDVRVQHTRCRKTGAPTCQWVIRSTEPE